MPEGPECRHITDVLREYCLGKTIIKTEVLSGRYQRHGDPVGYALLTKDSFQITEIGVKGKFIWWKLEKRTETGTERGTEKETERGTERGTETGTERGTEKETERGTERGTETGTERGTEKETERGIDNKKLYLFNTLGMSGQWTNQLDKHCRVVFRLSDGSDIYFRDIRNFGTLKIIQDETLFKKKLDSLGVDILNNSITEEEVIKLFRKRPEWTLPKFLMNQNYFSGIGNYLKCEALHRTRLSPHLQVREIEDTRLVALFKMTCQIAKESYQAKGASFKTYSDPDSNKGKYSFQFQVYGKKTFNDLPIIVEKTLDGRSTYWCPDYLNRISGINESNQSS